MANSRIVTCFPLSDNQVGQIRSVAGSEYEITVATQDSIANDIFKADIFCGHAKVPLDWAAVVKAGRLKWIQSSAAGLDHCLVPEVIESEILVSGCSGLFANQVAEQALTLLLGLVRRLPVFFRAQQIAEFVRRPTDDLHGKSVGILGFGGNGKRIAEVIRPMVPRIEATDLFVDHCRQFAESGLINAIHHADDYRNVLKRVDVLIVTLPLTPQNENLIGDSQFSLMKPGTYLVNVGRGSVIHTPSLVKHLAMGELAGAGIDVVEPEPLPPDSPLWGLDNVIITPHVGAQSSRRLPTTVHLFCQNLERFQLGRPLLNLVDKPLGMPRPENRIDAFELELGDRGQESF